MMENPFEKFEVQHSPDPEIFSSPISVAWAGLPDRNLRLGQSSQIQNSLTPNPRRV